MLGSMIQQELATMILRDLNDPRLPATSLTSITRVRVAPDLSIADVYVTIMGTPGQQSAGLMALKHSAGMMRAKLTKSLSTRITPYLKFHMDEDLKKELALLDVLQKVHDENAELDRRRAEHAPEGSTGEESTGEAPTGETTTPDQSSSAEPTNNEQAERKPE